MDFPYRKIQHGSTLDHQSLRSPIPDAAARQGGRAWVTDTLKEWDEALAGAPTIPHSQVVRCMGTDIYL